MKKTMLILTLALLGGCETFSVNDALTVAREGSRLYREANGLPPVEYPLPRREVSDREIIAP